MDSLHEDWIGAALDTELQPGASFAVNTLNRHLVADAVNRF